MLTPEEAALQSKLAGKKPLTVEQLVRRAKFRDGRRQVREAMVLWAAADARAFSAGKLEWAIWRIRCAERLIALGEPDRAVRLLRQATLVDWSSSALRQHAGVLEAGRAALRSLTSPA